jgi:hypothetical protein
MIASHSETFSHEQKEQERISPDFAMLDHSQVRRYRGVERYGCENTFYLGRFAQMFQLEHERFVTPDLAGGITTVFGFCIICPIVNR